MKGDDMAEDKKPAKETKTVSAIDLPKNKEEKARRAKVKKK
jgi:hypothetical protein